jgi:hypothetical protein
LVIRGCSPSAPRKNLLSASRRFDSSWIGAKSVPNQAEPGELRQPTSRAFPRFLLGKIIGGLRSLLLTLTSDLRVGGSNPSGRVEFLGAGFSTAGRALATPEGAAGHGPGLTAPRWCHSTGGAGNGRGGRYVVVAGPTSARTNRDTRRGPRAMNYARGAKKPSGAPGAGRAVMRASPSGPRRMEKISTDSREMEPPWICAHLLPQTLGGRDDDTWCQKADQELAPTPTEMRCPLVMTRR